MRPDCAQTRAGAGCASDDEIAAYAEGALSDRERARLERVIDGCTTCRQQLSDLTRMRSTLGDAGSRRAARRASSTGAGAPATIGRYEVIRELGAGGMGVVYEAHDPELDRRVALKVVRPDRAAPDSSARMRGEARAMARLRHPNVVAVHDVGEHDGQVYVAMELVDGETLAAWILRGGDWRDGLDRCVAAGRGLEAAHRAGLVHRDFKPHNVLCARDGRVFVTDFGLARARGDAGVPRVANPEAPIEATETGAIVGTPAYMSPEQHAGRRADARSDQFSFCVTAYECIYGRPPYGGTTWATRGLEVLEGHVLAPPRGSPVPRGVFDVLHRGLAVEPVARFPSMRALLDALTAAAAGTSTTPAPPPRSRWPWVAAIGGAIAVPAAAVWLLRDDDAGATPAPPDARRRAAAAPPDATPTSPAPPRSTDRFDVGANLADATARARAMMPDAALSSLVTWGVRPDGTADIADGAVIQYGFRSVERSDPRRLDAGHCLVTVIAQAGAVTAYEGTNTDCAAIALMAPPRCDLPAIWRRAIADGADPDVPARIEVYPDRDGAVRWQFSAAGGVYHAYPDDC